MDSSGSPWDVLSDRLRDSLRMFDAAGQRLRAFIERNPHAPASAIEAEGRRILVEEFAIAKKEDVELSSSVFWESDRGCVLVVAAIIDNLLEDLLRAFFRSRSKVSKDDLDFLLSRQPLPPLQSTGIKIRLCYALGLLTKEIRDTLNAIQTLRSKVAAHSRESMRLTPEAVDKIEKHVPAELGITSDLIEDMAEMISEEAGVFVPHDRVRFGVIAEVVTQAIQNEISAYTGTSSRDANS